MQNFSVLQLLKLLSAASASPSAAETPPSESGKPEAETAPQSAPEPAAPPEKAQTEKEGNENTNNEAITEFMQRHESAVNRAKQKK